MRFRADIDFAPGSDTCQARVYLQQIPNDDEPRVVVFQEAFVSWEGLISEISKLSDPEYVGRAIFNTAREISEAMREDDW